jgi:hypothetical protein
LGFHPTGGQHRSCISPAVYRSAFLFHPPRRVNVPGLRATALAIVRGLSRGRQTRRRARMDRCGDICLTD